MQFLAEFVSGRRSPSRGYTYQLNNVTDGSHDDKANANSSDDLDKFYDAVRDEYALV